MIARILWLALGGALSIVFLYVSRYWEVRLWGRDEFFGLRPQGGYTAQWLRGTDFAPFEVLIWAVGVFLILTVLQKIYDILNPPPKEGDDHD